MSATYDEEESKRAAQRVVERNIDALLERERRAKRASTLQDRIAASITRFTGSLHFVYLHLAAVWVWIAINVGLTPLPKFDPTFVLLATIASVEAIFLTSFVLMTQNRMQAEADRRADLDLQVSLLTEHELTQLAKVISELATRAGASAAQSVETAAIQRDIHPTEVLDALEDRKRDFKG